jgi:hypothetical protein
LGQCLFCCCCSLQLTVIIDARLQMACVVNDLTGSPGAMIASREMVRRVNNSNRNI